MKHSQGSGRTSTSFFSLTLGANLQGHRVYSTGLVDRLYLQDKESCADALPVSEPGTRKRVMKEYVLRLLAKIPSTAVYS